MCCQYSDVILWNCIYLYGTCCDVLPIQWCYTMELYLFVWNVFVTCLPLQWCYIMELCLFETNVLWFVANTVMLYCGIVFICMERVVMCLIQWCLLRIVFICMECCDVLPIQWCYTMELYLFVRNVLWCVYLYTVILYYGLYLFVWNVLWCVANTVMLYYWNCIYL